MGSDDLSFGSAPAVRPSDAAKTNVPIPRLVPLVAIVSLLGASCASSAASRSSAQDATQREADIRTAEDVAAELANPLAPITTLSVQFRSEYGLGPADDANRQVRLQPSFFRPSSGTSALLVRTILPVRFNEYPADESGLGDLSILPYYVPDTSARNFIGLTYMLR